MPPRQPHQPWHRWIWMGAQWVLSPVYYLFLASIPAVDAQTRLMLGKYLDYVVTDKHRVRSATPKMPAKQWAGGF
jgi:hypothetical protein